MGPDSKAIVLVAAVLTVLAAGYFAVSWDGRGGRRLGVRIAAGFLCLLTLSATAAGAVNHLTASFPTWSSLTGATVELPSPAWSTELKPSPPPSAKAAPSALPSLPIPSSAGAPGGSSMMTINVVGTVSKLSLPAYVYLPAGYAEQAAKGVRYPVIEALHGYPGSPKTWLNRMHVRFYLDREISSGRMAPTVVVFPYQTPDLSMDTECVDLVNGPKTETFLTVDLPAAIRARLRTRLDRRGWGLIGYSAGGFCAMNLGLRHPDRYAAAASLSGYGAPGITIGDGSEETNNNPMWRLRHLPPPAIGLYLAFALDDKHARRDNLTLNALVRPPLSLTTATVVRGGHSVGAWQAMEAPAFDWLSGWLGRPTPPVTTHPGNSAPVKPTTTRQPAGKGSPTG